MPIAQIANGESGSSVRTKLNNTLIEYADIVRDFGADPTGVVDSQPAFQAAINLRYSGIFVPSGTFLINSTINLTNVVDRFFIRGVGETSFLNANFNGFVIDNYPTSSLFIGPSVIEGLNIKNANRGGGCIRLAANGDVLQVRNCDLQGNIGVQLCGVIANAQLVASSVVSSCRCNSLSANEIGLGSIGIQLGPETACQNCSVVGFDNNIQAYGAGGYIHGCRIEVGNKGIVLGHDATGAGQSATGWHISGTSFEANIVGIEFDTCDAIVIDGCVITSGSNGPPNATGHSAVGLNFGLYSDVVIQGLGIGAPTPFTTGAVQVFGGSSGQSQPLVTLIGCSIRNPGGTVWATTGGNTYECWEAYNCLGVPSFAITGSLLPNLVYLPVGSRRMITDVNNTFNTFGTALTNTGGTVTQNCGTNSNVVPATKRPDGNWYVG